MTPYDIEQRFQRLERALRRWRIATVGALLMVVSIVVFAYRSATTPEPDPREIVLASGGKIARLSPDGLTFDSGAGSQIAILNEGGGGPRMTLRQGPDHPSSVTLSASQWAGEVRLDNGSADTEVHLAASATSATIDLSSLAKDGQTRNHATTQASGGTSSLVLVDNKSQASLSAGITTELELTGRNGVTAVRLGPIGRGGRLEFTPDKTALMPATLVLWSDPTASRLVCTGPAGKKIFGF